MQRPSVIRRVLDALLMPLCMLGIFVFSRMLFWSSGVRFDTFPLLHFWQHLDIPVLKDDLLRGLLYLHSQPPGFNLFLGIVLKLFPENASAVFQALFLLCGFAGQLLAYRVLRLSGFGRWAALVLATILALSPGAILYENWLFYTRPVATLLLLAALGLLGYEHTRQRRFAALFLASVTAVCLTRSAFHLVYLLGCAALVLAVTASDRRWLARASAVAVAPVLALYIKNFALFGVFGATSWTGMNLWHVAGKAVPPETVGALVDAGKIPPVAAVKPFSVLSQYPPEYAWVPPRYADIACLAEPQKHGTWVKNLNHYGYIRVSRDYGRAAWVIVRHSFGDYIRSVGRSWLIYGQPSWDFEFVRRNAPRIRAVIDVYSCFLAGAAEGRQWITPQGLRRCRVYFRPLVFGSLLLVTSVAVLRAWRRRGSAPPATLGFMVLTVLYVAGLGNACEQGENNRFRAATDPLLYLAVMVSLRQVGEWVRGSRAEATGSSDRERVRPPNPAGS